MDDGGHSEALSLTENAKVVLEKRYLRKDARGRAIETPDGMFRRVAAVVAEADRAYDPGNVERWEAAYYEAMSGAFFLPNSPTLMNAGTRLGQLAACFVLPVEDSISSIFEAVRDMALIHQSGGGTGFSFSHLRPQGDVAHEVGEAASGPVSFMRVFDVATDVVKQGGRRRGANMGVLAIDHPDILEFVRCKDDTAAFRNFNLSVAVPDAFLEAVKDRRQWDLLNPRTGEVAGSVPAVALWEEICAAAWRTGDPGVLFIDEINRHNPTPALGRIEATNPCGEQPLLPFEACNLGSVNLSRLAGPEGFAWERLDELTRLAVRFLDNVIDVSRYPLDEIAQITRANRKVGLGVMGLADALITLGIPYASQRALDFAGSVMERMRRVALEASVALAEERGPFPNCARSAWPSRGIRSIRNATLLTVAPTGTISIIAGASSGIEPLFAVAYVRTGLDGTELPEVSERFVQEVERLGLPVDSMVGEAMRTGSVQSMNRLPPEVRALFMTALDIPVEWHVRMQAAVQRHVDNAVSKTVNLPNSAAVDDVRKAYELGAEMGCKGVTVFRYGSRGEQVLAWGAIPSLTRAGETARAHGEFAGECRVCST